MLNPFRPRHFIAIVAIVLTFVSCMVARHSRFVTDNNLLGQDKTSISEKFGKPYKVGVTPEFEDWYYKENIFTDKWYEVTTILHFTNGKLTSIEPGRERPLHQSEIDLKTDSKS